MAAKGSAGRTDAHSDAVRESESSARAAGSVQFRHPFTLARRAPDSIGRERSRTSTQSGARATF